MSPHKCYVWHYLEIIQKCKGEDHNILHYGESCGIQRLQNKAGVKTEVDVVHTNKNDDTTIAVAGVIHQDTDPELPKVPDLEGYHQKEGV